MILEDFIRVNGNGYKGKIWEGIRILAHNRQKGQSYTGGPPDPQNSQDK